MFINIKLVPDLGIFSKHLSSARLIYGLVNISVVRDLGSVSKYLSSARLSYVRIE